MTPIVAMKSETAGQIILGLLILYNNWRSVQNAKAIKEVKTIVDGPFSLALKDNAALAVENAELKRAVANRTGDHVDLKEAHLADQVASDAKAVQENREAGKITAKIP